MVVHCDQCCWYFDDEFRSTLCPHKTFPANDGTNRFYHHPRAYLKTIPPPHGGDRQRQASGTDQAHAGGQRK